MMARGVWMLPEPTVLQDTNCVVLKCASALCHSVCLHVQFGSWPVAFLFSFLLKISALTQQQVHFLKSTFRIPSSFGRSLTSLYIQSWFRKLYFLYKLLIYPTKTLTPKLLKSMKENGISLYVTQLSKSQYLLLIKWFRS